MSRNTAKKPRFLRFFLLYHIKAFSSILCVALFGRLYLGVPLHKETEVVEIILFEAYRVTLFGHRYIDHFREVEENLERVLDELSLQHPYMDFYVGNNGDFDRIATSVILRLIDRWGKENFSINLVLPYPKANMDLLEKQFDSVMIPPTLHNVHTKAAITERNRWMVENCDLLIAHVVHERGGAWTAMRVAEQLGMPVLRI